LRASPREGAKSYGAIALAARAAARSIPPREFHPAVQPSDRRAPRRRRRDPRDFGDLLLSLLLKPSSA
jgi:hypothetical protein